MIHVTAQIEHHSNDTKVHDHIILKQSTLVRYKLKNLDNMLKIVLIRSFLWSLRLQYTVTYTCYFLWFFHRHIFAVAVRCIFVWACVYKWAFRDYHPRLDYGDIC